MATLEKIRSHAGLLVAVVGIALLGFIIEDFLNSGSSYFRQSQNNVVTVDGTPIDYQEYQQRVNEMTEVYKTQMQMQYGQSNLTEEQTAQLRQNVYSTLVHELVMNEAMDKLGISVTSNEIFDMIEGNNVPQMVQQFPLFINEQGRYDKTRALSVLKTINNIESVPVEQQEQVQQIRDMWLFWERNLKLQRMQEKYTNLLSKAIVTNPLEAKDAYEGSAESSDIVYAMQSYSSIPDSTVKIDDAEIRKIYNQRKDQYKQKESRVIDYIAVDVRPSQEDYNQVSQAMDDVKAKLVATDSIADIVTANSKVPYINAFLSEKALDEDMKRFVETAEIGAVDGPIFKNDSYSLYKLVAKTSAPDSVKISDIYLASQAGVSEALSHLGDSLMNVLKAGGNFEELAKQYSALQSGATGGDMGWFTDAGAYQQVGTEFRDAIFAAAINQPTLLKTGNGIHILKVTERTANVPKYKLGYVVMDVLPSSKTYTAIYNDLNSFIAKNNTVEKMTAAVKDGGYELIPNVTLTSDEYSLGAIQDARPVVRWAFEKTKKGALSDIIDCKTKNQNTGDDRSTYVVAALRDVLPEGYQSVEAVTPVIRQELLPQKKGEKIIAELKAKNLTSLDAYAQAMSSRIDTVKFVTMTTSRITGIGMEPVLNGWVSYAAPNQLTGPVAGENGVYIFNVYNRTKDSAPYNEQSQMRAMEANNAARVGYFAIQKLIDNAKVTDNRIRFE